MSLWGAFGVGCGARGPAAPAPEVPSEGSEPAPAEEAAQTEGVTLPPAHRAVPSAPALCRAYVEHPTTSPSAPACSPESLAAALAVNASEARDAALALLEPCDSWPRDVLRALRAELAPAECGDELVSERLAPSEDSAESRAGAPAATGASVEVQETLLALALGARLRRLAVDPPAPPAADDKETLQAYFQETLFPWITEQSSAIHQLAERGARLGGYARGIVAVEAGMADMRFVEIARAVPIPREMREDAELRDTYYASLDEALEPRKRRGRDAALAGLRELAAVGVLEDTRLVAARGLLSRVYGGHRIDALDRLLLPTDPPAAQAAAPSGSAAPSGAVPSGSAAPSSAVPSGSAAAPARDAHSVQLAAQIPTFYVPWLLPEVETDAELLSGFLRQGLPRSVRLDLGSRTLDERTALLLARGHIELGRTYFAAEHFAQAQKLLQGRSSDEARFLAALATALMAGPRDAVELLARGPRFADALGNLEGLDQIADSRGPFAGLARFDATYLRELVAPPEDAAYWEKLAAGYDKAATALSSSEQKEARARAEAARATARAIGSSASKR